MEDKNKNSTNNQIDDLLGELHNIDEEKIKKSCQKAAEEENRAESLEVIKEILENTKSNIQKALDLISNEKVDSADLLASLNKVKEATIGNNSSERIIEGVFNGEVMVGSDGKQYNVPANYASKSKLVEGDILKLTITKDGSFIYKQIGPIEREKLIATLAQDEVTGDWYAIIENNKKWKLLTASVTYFQGSPGDEVVILVPKGSKSQWAAVENIIRK
jgi:hypothetical protein